MDSRNEKADDTAFHSPRRITPLLMVLNSRYHFCYRNIKTKTVELFHFPYCTVSWLLFYLERSEGLIVRNSKRNCLLRSPSKLITFS